MRALPEHSPPGVPVCPPRSPLFVPLRAVTPCLGLAAAIPKAPGTEDRPHADTG